MFELPLEAGDRKTGLELLLASPSRIWRSSAWDKASSDGTFDLMDNELRHRLSDLFDAAGYAEQVQRELGSVEAELSALIHPGRMTQAERRAFLKDLYKADRLSELMEMSANYFVTELGSVELVPAQARRDRERLQTWIDRLNDDAKTFLGECAVRVSLPAQTDPQPTP